MQLGSILAYAPTLSIPEDATLTVHCDSFIATMYIGRYFMDAKRGKTDGKRGKTEGEKYFRPQDGGEPVNGREAEARAGRGNTGKYKQSFMVEWEGTAAELVMSLQSAGAQQG